MAHKTYNELWRETMTMVIHLLDVESSSFPPPHQSLPSPAVKSRSTGGDKPPESSSTPPYISTASMYHHYATLYISYLSTLRNLEDCYDQMAHPQKRKEVISMLDAVMGRLLEVYDILILLCGTEYIPLEDSLASMCLTPSALILHVPRYFREERQRELEERDKLLNALLAQYTVKHDGEEKNSEPLTFTPNMSLEEAIRIIQINERGRQGRRRMKEIRDSRIRDKRVVQAPRMEPEFAAVLIQKIFRGHLTRKRTKAMREEELVFIGMKASQHKRDVDPVEKADVTRARRKLIQTQNELEYQQAVTQIKQSLLDQEGPDIKERTQDDVRRYFLAHKEQVGKFPVFPDEQAGGSAKMLNPLMTPPPAAGAVPSSRPPPIKSAAKPSPATAKTMKGASTPKPSAPTAKSNGKPTPTSSKGAPSKPASKGSKKSSAVSSDVPPPLPNIPGSCFLPDIHCAAQRYLSVWAGRDEEANFAQKHEVELVRETLRPEVEQEIRKQVDELLRVELESLKEAVETKGKGKKKKGKKKKDSDQSQASPKKEPAGKDTTAPTKKEKKDKKKKSRKGPKDPTADRSIQSLYAELVSMNIILNYLSSNTKLLDFVNIYNYNQSSPTPSSSPSCPMGEKISLFGTVQAVMNLCILPLGSSQAVSSNLSAPTVPRSVLLVAPPSYGKSMLCNIIAYETGSVLFNLDPANLSNANTSRSMSLVIHMVFKVAKAMAPSVIYIDHVERVFMKQKKSKKEEGKIEKPQAEGEMAEEEPLKKIGVAELAAMMRKELVSQINMLQPGDRVLVVGMTRQPGLATGGNAMGFDRQLLLTHPDYQTLCTLWVKLVQDGARELEQGENAILARLAEGLPAGIIQKVVNSAIKGNTDKRALKSQDFIPHLAKHLSVAKEVRADELSLCLGWWATKRPIRTLATAPSNNSAPPSDVPKKASAIGGRAIVKPSTPSSSNNNNNTNNNTTTKTKMTPTAKTK